MATGTATTVHADGQLVTADADAGLVVEADAADRPNERATGDADVSAPGAAVRTLVVTAREDLEIARQVTDLVTRAR